MHNSRHRIGAAIRQTLYAAICGLAGTYCMIATANQTYAQHPSETVLLAAGDIAQCNTSGAALTAALIERLPGAVLAAGDLTYPNGSSDDFKRCYEPTWGKLRDRTLPAPGNHEYLTRGAAGYFGYFHDRAGESGKGYYSKNVGSWHIVALNSNIDTATGSEQVKWLQKDLSENHLTCVLAFWHHPRFSSGAHGNNLHMAAIWTTLYQHSASVVIAGHDHDYERFAPLNSAGQRDEKHGIRSFVVGTGGAKLFDFSMRGPDSEAWQANSWGVLKLTLQPDSYSWEFIPVADTKFHDSGSSRCVTK